MRQGTETFQKNLQALRETVPEMAAELASFELRASYGITLSDAQEWLVWQEPGAPCLDASAARGWRPVESAPSGEQAEPGTTWIHGPESPRDQYRDWLGSADAQDPDLWVVYRSGLGSGVQYLFRHINELEAEAPANRRMLVLEDRLELLHASWSVADWTEMIQSDRVFFMIGRDLAGSAERFLQQYPESALSNAAVIPGSVLDREHDRRRRQLVEDIAGFRGRVEDSFAQRAAAAAQTRRSDPVRHVRRVVFIAPGHNYLQAACVQALTDMTHHAEHPVPKTKEYRFNKRGACLQMLERFQPDLVVGINTTPRRYVDHSLLDSVGCLTAAWYVDNPARFHDTDEDFTRTDLVACFDGGYLDWMREHGARDAFALHTAAGLSAPAPPVEKRDGPKLLFVGELGSDGFEVEESLLRTTDPELLRLCEAVLEDFLDSPTRPLGQVYAEHGPEERRPFRGYVVNYLENKATYRLRRAYLEPLAAHQPVIYGPAEWGDAARSGKLAGCWAGSRVPYGENLADLYAS